MIYFYTGVPGSGKSYHVARDVYHALQKGKHVISNVNIDINKISELYNKPLGCFIYVNNDELTNNAYSNFKFGKRTEYTGALYSYIQGLYGFASNFHRRDKHGKMIEHQSLIILDECQELFNPRSWNRKDRLTWCKFFRIHRHLGYDCILISQDDKSVDKQIRPVLEKQILHRNVKSYKLLGKVLSLAFGGNLFMCIESMYGMNKKDAHLKSYPLVGESKYFDIYDSYEVL